MKVYDLTDPIELPFEFKQWLLGYVVQEIRVNQFTGYSTIPSLTSPWLIDVDCFLTPIASTTWATLVGSGGLPSGNALYGGHRESSGAVNASVSFDLMLADGTWTFELLHVKGADVGIYTLSLDGTSIGTLDGYNATTAVNSLSSLASVRVMAGKHRLAVTMATKNASSSSFVGRLQRIQCRRTA